MWVDAGVLEERWVMMACRARVDEYANAFHLPGTREEDEQDRSERSLGRRADPTTTSAFPRSSRKVQSELGVSGSLINSTVAA